jgi:glycosyltransferase involved in cell wall biosynthesis
MTRLSLIVITKNEEQKLARCLASAQSLADEIIVVDSGSTDHTLEIARRFTDKIYFRAWDDDYAAQKNYAADKAGGDWILSLDADEELSGELSREIRDFIASDQAGQFAGMLLPRKNLIFGRWLRHGECWPDHQLRLFRRRLGKFERPVHEFVALEGAVGTLRSPIVHYSHADVSKYFQVIDKYTDLEVKVLTLEKAGASLWAVVAYPLGKFLKAYFYERGFLDGVRGLTLALLMTYYSFLKRYKYWRKVR